MMKLLTIGGVRNKLGLSYIEANQDAYAMCANDRLHPQIEEIHAEMEGL